MIHRGVISTMERMVSVSHRAICRRISRVARAGAGDCAADYGKFRTITREKVYQKIFDAGFRVDLDDRNEKLQAKIRDAQLQKIPYMLVIGGKEAEAGSVSVRHRSKGDLGPRPAGSVQSPISRRKSPRGRLSRLSA